MPSVWRRYLELNADDLPPDFALSDWRQQHWRNPVLRRLLYLAHIWWSLGSCFISLLILWYLQVPQEHLLFAICYILLFSSGGGLVASLSVSFIAGLLVSSIGSVLLSLPIGLEGNVLFSMAENIALTVVMSVPDNPVPLLLSSDNPRVLLTVLLGTFLASLVGSLMQSNAKKAFFVYNQQRQIGSIVIGVTISGLAIWLATEVTSLAVHVAAQLMMSGVLFSVVYDSLIAVIFSSALFLIWGIQTGHWRNAMILGILTTAIFGGLTLLVNQLNQVLILHQPLVWMHRGLENGLLFILLFAFPYTFAKRIASPWAGIVAGIFASSGTYVLFAIWLGQYSLQFLLPLVLFACTLGLTFHWWRPLLFYPLQAAWNLLIFRSEEQRTESTNSLMCWHSAFWDEHQHLPLVGLDYYLVMVIERYPAEGQCALEYISKSPQNWAAQAAQIELDARHLHNCADVHTISSAHRHLAAGELSGLASALLRSFSRLSRDVEAALSQESNYNQRLALDAVEERLDGLLRELTRSSEPYAQRFYPIAASWRRILAEHIKALSEVVESRQEINNPYVIGIPLTEHQEIFVGRSDISEQIERLLLDKRCPPLLLYGQRRTGKTSLLNNLGRLLPWDIIPIFVDLQGPASLAKDYAGFLYNIGRAMLTSAKRHREIAFPALQRQVLQEDPFTYFDEWLDTIEHSLQPEQTVLLSLDEFSALEHAIAKGRLDEVEVLGMFRHIIQHRPRFKILLSGSHTLDEFERWASYLINVQIVHISYLQAQEALQLIEQPVKDFPLRYTYEASQRVMDVTRCHPAMVQLVCAEMVNVKNKHNIQERRLAQVPDVEAAIPGALQHGRFFFADIANNQISPQGLSVLRYIAQQGEGAIVAPTDLPDLEDDNDLMDVLRSLQQRELIELLGDGYRFQVELIRRWFSNNYS